MHMRLLESLGHVQCVRHLLSHCFFPGDSLNMFIILAKLPLTRPILQLDVSCFIISSLNR